MPGDSGGLNLVPQFKTALGPLVVEAGTRDLSRDNIGIEVVALDNPMVVAAVTVLLPTCGMLLQLSQ